MLEYLGARELSGGEVAAAVLELALWARVAGASSNQEVLLHRTQSKVASEQPVKRDNNYSETQLWRKYEEKIQLCPMTIHRSLSIDRKAKVMTTAAVVLRSVTTTTNKSVAWYSVVLMLFLAWPLVRMLLYTNLQRNFRLIKTSSKAARSKDMPCNLSKKKIMF